MITRRLAVASGRPFGELKTRDVTKLGSGLCARLSFSLGLESLVAILSDKIFESAWL
jgi:hypothetical protein